MLEIYQKGVSFYFTISEMDKQKLQDDIDKQRWLIEEATLMREGQIVY